MPGKRDTADVVAVVMDGRLERTQRTRKALIDAYIDIARETKRIPTTLEVARRARCSLRTVFERFGSLGGLGIAVFDSILAEHTNLAPVGDEVHGDRQSRIRYQATLRAQTCETWQPIWRIVMRNEGISKALEERIERVRSLMRARIELMYRAELGTLSPSSRNAVLIALEALTDFATWGRMREHHGLSVEQAIAVWTEGIDRLLPPTPPS
jgi:TetR/AcrR family transcriptional regulator of autoinduction and epiphytic fitness